MQRHTYFSSIKTCFFAVIFIGLTMTTTTASASDKAAFTLATYNLRYDNPNDGENSWALRKEAVKALIRFHDFDLFGTQEGLPGQIEDLAAMTEYEHVGVGRDDGKSAGEHSAIFFKKERFTLLKHGDYWLSQTPDVPSLGWDAECCKRIASWAQLRDQFTKKEFFIFDVHFDHLGVIAKRESAKLMLKKIAEIAGDQTVICVGDFNSTPDTEQIATMQSLLRNAREVSLTPPYGPVGTFNNFEFDSPMTYRIDYIFVSKKIDVLKYGVLSDSFNRHYPSDHHPVMTKVRIN